MSEVLEVTDLSELQSLVADNETVVVDFHAPAWCVPCKRFHPHFVKAAEQVDAVFVTVDIDKAPEIVSEFSIQSVPTVKLFRDGESKNLRARTVIQLVYEIQA